MLCSLYGTGCSPHSCWLPALYLADLQVCFWPPVRWRVLVHGRYRLDHRPLLHHLRPTCKRCHGRSSRSRKYYIELLFIFCKSGDSGEQTVVVLSLLKAFVCVCVCMLPPVWRCSCVPSCRPVLGNYWEVQSDQILHSSHRHPSADETRTGTTGEVRNCICWNHKRGEKIVFEQHTHNNINFDSFVNINYIILQTSQKIFYLFIHLLPFCSQLRPLQPEDHG